MRKTTIWEEVGFELDYDYETFVRDQKPNREIFRSVYDNAEKPSIYLEVKYSSKDADAAAAECAVGIGDAVGAVNTAAVRTNVT